MKKVTSIIMALMLATSLSSCGSSENASSSTSEATSTSETVTESAAEETVTNSVSEEKAEVEKEEAAPKEKLEDSEDYKELSALGDVEVENGILSVKITVPADIMGEITQEDLDTNAGETYISAKLNDDGSVTYKMTKAQHIVVRRKSDGAVYVMDTKWKILDEKKANYGISQADMYQMYAYQKKYGAEEIVLIYPKTERVNEKTEIEYRSRDGVNVRVYFIDLFEKHEICG